MASACVYYYLKRKYECSDGRGSDRRNLYASVVISDCVTDGVPYSEAECEPQYSYNNSHVWYY